MNLPENQELHAQSPEQGARVKVGLPRTLIVALSLLIAVAVIGIVVFASNRTRPNASKSTGDADASAYRLTADFPDTPKSVKTHGAFFDTSGHYLSHATEQVDDVLPLYYALTVEDVWDVPLNDSPEKAMQTEMSVGGYSLPSNLTITSDKAITFDGFAAHHLTFSGLYTLDGSDYNVYGDGIVAFVPGDKTAVYVAIALDTDQTTAAQKSAIEHFFNSVKIVSSGSQ
ncbi:MAG: hypothetical protein KGL00_09785 [Gammaproteobacteria bacterium]|nr:hypothetical protein [Gammaproteobacteria bacterium]MDE2274474.1 hypothetical protein [Gammaproteobacteria bacterium]